MTAQRDERRLRELFARLREEDARAAPDFEPSIRPRPNADFEGGARILRPRLALAAVALAALGLGVWQLAEPGGAEQPEGRLALELQGTSARWRGPTDFLLERRVTSAWRGVPRIGRTAAPAATAGEGAPAPAEPATPATDTARRDRT